MKMFMFYPNDFCRCYLIASSKEDVISRKDQLFRDYMKDDNPWVDLDDPDDQFYIEDKRIHFYKGIEKVKEIPRGFKFDSHY